MGAFLDYHNKRNKTSNTVIAPTNSNNTSSFLAYHKKREEERKKQEALRKAQEEAKSTSKKMSGLKAEALRKQYGDKLSEFNDIKLPKATNNYEKNNATIDTPDVLKNSASYQTKKKLESEPVRLSSYEPKKNTIGAIAENLLLGTKKGIMNFSESGVSAINGTYNDRDKMMDKLTTNTNKIREEKGFEPLPTAEESKKIILGDSYNKDLFGRDKEEQQKKWEEKKNNIDTKIASNIENTDSVVGKKFAEIAPSIGNQLPGYVLPGGAGLVYFTGSAKGAYMEDAKARGMSEEDANTYSGIMAIAEGLTEQIGAGLTKNVGKKVIKGSSKEALKYFGLDVAENFIEEAVMEPISETTATLTGGSETANWDNMGKRMLNSGIDGALNSIIMAGTSAGVGKAVQLTNKINNGQKVNTQEVSEAVKETLASDKVNQEELKSIIKENTNEIIKQEVENDTNSLYNNNESEVDINGEQQAIESNDQRGTTGLFTQHEGRTTNERGYQIINEEQIARTKQEEIEYIRKPENQITNLSNNQAKIKEAFESKGAKVVFYSLNSNKGGYYDNGILYINENNANDVQQLDEAIHEYAHYLIRDNTEFNSKISSIAEEIVRNEEYGNSEAIRNYIMDRDENINIEDVDRIYQTVIEEILADYAIDVKKDIDFSVNNQYGIDSNILNNYKKILKDYLPDIELENSNRSSFSMQQNKKIAPPPVQQYTQQTENKKVIAPLPKTMNPTEIGNLKLEDASTTPKLEQKNYKTGNKQSSFLSNIITDSKFLSEDLRQEMAKEDNIRYYQGITNEKTLENAYNKLQKDGQSEVIKWHSKDSKEATAEDVAEGWILLKQYQDSGDYQSAVEVAKKMRDIGTTAGQTVQAYNILSRLTPEGMFYYAQSELNEAYNKMVQGKSKKWIEENQSKFDLTPEETQTILDIMKDVSTMEDGYDKKVKLAEVQKIITDKIPPTKGQSIKAWMRISMLFNPKTQVRNIAGNAVVVPVNMFSDSVSAGIDRLIAKRTGVRTTGNTSLKNYGKGFKKGLYESYNDFIKGINTRNMEGNRFEISEGKSFKNKGIGKALNSVDNILNFSMDGGDRGFYEATFTNSINNQLVLNNTTQVTQDMIDIATTEALQRTWQDHNAYTQTVLTIRNALNGKIGKHKGLSYGLGDILIPFAKTPANLTKAIVDYSPVGLVKTLAIDARKFKNSLYNGQYTPQMQHKFVQNLGKATAGTFLYVLSYALAKAGIATGEADEDKDVKNFMKNSLGISSYSIKIGDKSFTYDWAQPIATPLAIMTNFVKYSEENPDANVLEKGINAMNIGTEQLLQQSFMESLNTVLNGNGTTLENLSQAVLELPARAVPTFSKQVADMVDGTQRTTFEYGKPIKSAINSVAVKIPGVSKLLPASVDTLGNEIQKYGGNNNIFNVMFNPANTNKGELSKAGEEIYEVYEETGDTTIFPRTAPYYINNKGKKITMTAEERNKFQSISGKYVNSTLNKLLKDSDYKKLSDEEKANIINEIVSDSYLKAKYDVLKIDSKEYEKLRNTLEEVSTSSYYNYKFKTKDLKKDSEKIDVLINANYTNEEKTALYENNILSSIDKKYPLIKNTGIDINKYLKYKNQEFIADKKDDGTVDGKSISGSKKQKVKSYIENMDITYTQKLVLYGLEYTPSDSDKTKIVNYVKSIPDKTNKEKLEMLDQFEWVTIYKNGGFKY